MKAILFCIIAFIASALLSCTFVNSGTGSSTETGFISGKVYEPDGTTPAKGVTVYIRSSDAFMTITAGEKPALSDADSTVTNEEGAYSFDTTIVIGTYMVEALSGEYAASLNPVDVKSKTVSQVLQSLTLQPAGSISGMVELIGGDDPSSVYVLVAGVNRFARVAADGSFCIPTLAEGDYDLRILATLNGYDIFDTSDVSVVSGDTIRLDTIILPYSGLQRSGTMATRDRKATASLPASHHTLSVIHNGLSVLTVVRERSKPYMKLTLRIIMNCGLEIFQRGGFRYLTPCCILSGRYPFRISLIQLKGIFPVFVLGKVLLTCGQ